MIKSTEVGISFREAARIVPREPRPCVRTIRRWAETGLKGQRLRSWYVGGLRRTSEAALTEFLEAVNRQQASETD